MEKQRDLSFGAKVGMFVAMVVPTVLLYYARERRVDVFDMKCLRRVI